MTPEQEKAIKDMLDAIEQMGANGGHILPFVLPVGGDRLVFQEAARRARAAGWNAHFDGRQPTTSGPKQRR